MLPVPCTMARGGVAVGTDTSEVFGFSAAVGPSALSEAVSIGSELVVADSAVGVSAAVGLGELSEAVSIGGELVVADSAAEISVVIGLGELCEAVSIGGELLVADSAIAGVGDAASDGVFG